MGAERDEQVVGLTERVASGRSEVLGHPVHDARARFPDLGGDSLAAMRLLVRLREDLEIDLSMVDLFDAKTIEAQADVVAAALQGR